MTELVYDGTMAGFLTAVFAVYAQGMQEVLICKDDTLQADVFAQRIPVVTDAEKARRVWAGLSLKLSPEAQDQYYYTYLSELPGIENTLLAYARYVFAAAVNIETDHGHPAVLAVVQTARKVWREKHRMEAFVRFAQQDDGLFYAAIDPDHNVLPLITTHFRSRYADQDWLIYDSRRKYGIHYRHAADSLTEVLPEWREGSAAAGAEGREAAYQQLWKDYVKHTGIPERRNMKLHLRHMPLRYWKHLTEKQL